MNQELIHVYFMPGMAANPAIFEYIDLPQDQFKLHWLEWILPDKHEGIKAYAERMSHLVVHDNCVLIGVSFGGILVQEMSSFLNLHKLIIISSVKNRTELPRRMKVARKTRAYKLIPTQLIGNVDALTKFTFGKTVNKRISLYKKYLSMNNKRYLDWAIRELICWDQLHSPDDIIHIHGEKDAVFPLRHINQCITVEGGTHIMIINKYKWFNENLPKLILG